MEERRKEDKKIEELANYIKKHVEQEEPKIDKMWVAIFGDEETNTIGMKQKVDDIHTRITQVDGIGGFLKWLIIIGGALGALKLWILKQ